MIVDSREPTYLQYNRTLIVQTPMIRYFELVFESLPNILPIAQENKSLGNFSHFIITSYVLYTL